MQRFQSLTLSLPKATIDAHSTVSEATIVAHIPWLPSQLNVQHSGEMFEISSHGLLFVCRPMALNGLDAGWMQNCLEVFQSILQKSYIRSCSSVSQNVKPCPHSLSYLKSGLFHTKNFYFEIFFQKSLLQEISNVNSPLSK